MQYWIPSLIIFIFNIQNLNSQYSLNKGYECIYLKDIVYVELEIGKEIYYENDFVSFDHKYFMKIHDFYNNFTYKIGLESIDSIKIYPTIVNDEKNGVFLEFENGTGILNFNYFNNGIQINTSFSYDYINKKILKINNWKNCSNIQNNNLIIYFEVSDGPAWGFIELGKGCLNGNQIFFYNKNYNVGKIYSYKDGKENGIWSIYDYNNCLVIKQTWMFGKLINEEKFNCNGKTLD